ncbi:type II toxin-antitoxin system PemK/MazF family toxin [Deltaproteobacteria bacterium OttesenSCG-928-K17]|nr:type II toxin-antitoxin system PemK/MazF family toxin [Deltaproteobacteria bacterium OttesenSCG-928-K17]
MVKPGAACPKQGQILKLDLDPTLGHEQKGYRPVLVVSATIFNRHTGFCWVVPATTPKKGLPNEIRLPDGLAVHGTLLLSQLRSIDWRARAFSVSCSVPPEFLEDINARLTSVFEIE